MTPTDPGSPRPSQQLTPTLQLPVETAAGDEPREKRRRWLRWAVPLLACLLGFGVAGAGRHLDRDGDGDGVGDGVGCE
ncbi:hypothetical protein [Geodermatophilus sp. DSM 44513]|uniref:hypothetical protein n=1 Tax=Geodermatophilus sp. DSM 44513 TaxID=1528104 RepID=UPI0012877B7E|nr:hypothetical protein [Geodermatophilus sp. DSM 44513]WNV74212.1 hypothetical protein RTG05_14570 [Geodermatophilus sp. DSM 44513]